MYAEIYVCILRIVVWIFILLFVFEFLQDKLKAVSSFQTKLGFALFFNKDFTSSTFPFWKHLLSA
jgi:hypothetical protein